MKDDQIRILIEKDLKESFKKHCNDNDKDMSKVIIRLIKKYMEEQNDRNISDKKQA